MYKFRRNLAQYCTYGWCTVLSLFSERKKKKNNTYPKYTGEYYSENSHKQCNISAFYKATCEICR